MMNRVIAVLLILIFTFHYTASQNIDSSIARYGNEYGQERTYLQYDKSTYVPGEIIWFKAYLMEGIFPAEQGSKTFYTDWTDDKGNVLSHIVSPLEGATTNGQFDIPANYSGKFIHVKAYTKWMLNFDTAFLYEKDILILSRNGNSIGGKTSIVPTLVFFPEGGDVVEGVVNKIAFKVNDQWGRPVKIKGTIKNNNGKTIDSLRIFHDGMGYLFLIPQPGETFNARWKDEKGIEYTTPLPVIKPSGISMQVTISGSRRNFNISAIPGAATNPGLIHIVGTQSQFQVFKVTKDVSRGNVKGAIPVQDLPSGILTITVFDDKWNPLAERITYINNEEYKFNAEMNVQRWGLNKRAKNEIEIAVPDSLPSNFAVSVTDADIDADSSNNIISHFLLTSDLKGQVYNPWYYFSSTSDSISKNLDLVMLTHGWRRFKWEDVVKGKMPVIGSPKDTSYLTLSGKIYGATPTQLREKPYVIVVMSQKAGGGNKILYIPVEPSGVFNEPSLVFFDTAHIYYQLSKSIKEASLKFMENRLAPFRNRVSASGNFYNQLGDTTGNSRHFQLSDEMAKLLQQYEGKVLETVVLKAKTKTPLQVMDEKYTSGLFGGGDGYQFDMVNDKLAFTSPNIFTYLQGKVAGLNISTAGSTPSLQWRGGTPLLFLDESPADASLLSSINVSDVAYIKVFRPPFFGASGGSGGAIAIYTRRGDDAQNVPGKGLASNNISGYSTIRQFYAPNYSSFNATNERKDLRTTLYWNPQVVTTRLNNKAVLTFYNNDVSKKFRVIIEGMSKDGRLMHLEQIME
ncbi:MAG: hypothetical protein ABIU11_00755 [Chitinophagaceae bacterium]